MVGRAVAEEAWSRARWGVQWGGRPGLSWSAGEGCPEEVAQVHTGGVSRRLVRKGHDNFKIASKLGEGQQQR